MRRQDEENESMRRQLSSALPGRPMAFEKDIGQMLQQRMKTDPAALVKVCSLYMVVLYPQLLNLLISRCICMQAIESIRTALMWIL